MERITKTSMAAQEKKWQEESDARALARAKAIQADKKRMAGAARGAKRIAPEVEEEARMARTQATTIRRIARKK